MKLVDDFDFGFEPTELSTSAISFNFLPSGRINSLWLNESNGPFSSDVQFVTGPVVMADETTDDYLPGTILLGARTSPDDPWMVSRNSSATVKSGENNIEIDYDFSLLPELAVTGNFYESEEQPGVVIWDIVIKNKSRKSIEIGELGFPFAFLNTLDGFPLNDEGMNSLLTERMVLQHHIGGAGSYLAARRMCGDSPGLLIYPGVGTSWEFHHSAPMSLRVSPGWAGVPIVYVHSRATADREGWADWFYGHSSLVLEPKEEKQYQLCFAPIMGRHGFEVPLALAEYKIPTFRLSQGAVTPVDTQNYIEIAGTRPAQFVPEAEDAEIESESDEHGGIFAVSRRESGPLRVLVEDMDGRESWCHLFFVRPLAELINARAQWIFDNQLIRSGTFEHGILPADNKENAPELDCFQTPWGIIGSLADATYLVEKNIVYMDPEQVQAIDRYVEDFLLKVFHKPLQNTFASVCPPAAGAIAYDASRAQSYVHAIRFYEAVSRLARHAKMTRSEEGYCELADGLIEGLLKFSDREGLYSTALFGASDLIEKPAWKELRDKYLEQYRLPFWVGRHFSLTTLDEVAAIADQTHAISATGSVEQLLLTHRSTSPNWWSFGTEARPLVDYELHPELSDYGAMYPSYTTTSLSHTLLSWLNRDYTRLDEPSLRLAFGGLMAPWAMVREDGAASMGFCPDMASSQRGLSARTGDIGFALAEFIRRATVWVLPSAERGFITFGGCVEAYPRDGKPCLRIVPWDGVGRRIVIRHMNVEITVEGAKIDSLELNADLRWMTLTLDNPNEAVRREATIRIEGLWGTAFQCSEGAATMEGSQLVIRMPIEGARLREIEITPI